MKTFLSILSILSFLTMTSITTAAQTTEPVHRCGAETTKGTPCKNRVKQFGLKCHHHGGQTQSGTTYFCGAQTTKGTACRNKVRTQGARCHHHQ